MSAWDLLTANSSLPSGSAWDHLNAQEGGGEIIYTAEVINVADGWKAEIASMSAASSLKKLTTNAQMSEVNRSVTVQKIEATNGN